MKPSTTSSHKAIVVLLVLSFIQLYAVLGLAAPSAPEETASALAPQTPMGRLATRDNQPIMVNGMSTRGGTTIMSGATIETGDAVGATIDLPGMGSIEMAPNTKILVEFSAGNIKITITRGCAVVKVKTGTFGQIFTEKGLATSNDPVTKPEATLDVCFPSGSPAPIVNQGAAANAGAGAGAVGSNGTNPLVYVALFGGGGTLAAVLLANRGDNNSP
ncbi:MAG: hypothetical protein QOJ64_1925 [Acidobacteriota bacterium]|jgi:hypothetical protein|nr:hypothetical protein [Acidobacteriota bacterium]